MIVATPVQIEHYTRLGWWGQSTLFQLLEANTAAVPQRLAVADPPDRERYCFGKPRRLTYAALLAETDTLAAHLVALGVAKGDIVCVQLPNTVELVQLYFACSRIGAVISPIPVQYRERELQHILEKTRARAIVSHATDDLAALNRIRAVAASVGEAGISTAVIALTDAEPEATATDVAYIVPGPASADLRQSFATYLASLSIDANDAVTVCWTSGTEGFPKGIPRSVNHLLVPGRAVVEANTLFDGVCLLNPFPLVNTAALSGMLIPWVLTKGSLFLHQPFNLEVFLDQIRREGIAYTCAAPTVLNTLLQNEALLATLDFRRLNRIASGGAPLSEWMVAEFDKLGVHIVNCYGSNEGGALYSAQNDVPDPVARARVFPRYGWAGRRWRTSIGNMVETRLVDPETEHIIDEPGQPGELRVKGPNVFTGYLNEPAMTAAAFDRDGFYRTGDIFEIAGPDNACYKFIGRIKDIIIRGGFNISAAEVESLIMTHPAVRDAAVVGIPDARLGERVCAIVVGRDDAPPSLTDLVDHLRTTGRCATYKLPEHLIVIDALPRNPVGKVIKHALRASAIKQLKPQETQHAS